MVERRTDRWAAHPTWAAAVRFAVMLVPFSLSVLTAVLVGRLLPAGDTRVARVSWWLAVFVVSTVVLYVSDRLARRLLPLAVLLELSLVFPDHAPSRMRSLRTPSVRELDTRLARLRAHGATTPAVEVAETLVLLVGVLGLHDKRTRGHSERVRALVDLLTDEMGLSDEDRGKARWAALVHDLGKLTVPVAVLNKPSSLDDDEWETIRQHPEEGTRLAAGLLPWLGEWGRAIGEHHERWDGLGYPAGLAGEQISLSARIVAVADSYEVMTTSRSYSRARSAALARQELTDCAGAQFDPQVVRSFLSISLGRLRWVFGPLTWLAEVPLLALDRGGQAARLATAALGVGGLAVAGTIAQPAAAEPPGASPRPGVAASPFSSAPAVAESARSAVPVIPTLLPTPLAASPTPSGPSAFPTRASAVAVASAPPRATNSAPPAPRATGSAPPAPRATAAAGGPPATYWFAGRSGSYSLLPDAPTRAGPPPDTDGDGHPGTTLTPSASGNDTTDATERLVLERVVDRPLRLSGVPSVALWSRLASSKGNARVLVRLEDCASSGSCVVLAEGKVEDGTWSTGSFVVHDIALSSVNATVPAGHRLRLGVVANDSGTKADLWVAVGSAPAPSRLMLPVL